MVRSGPKLFRTKTLLNFAAKALSNSFFQKTRFRFEFLYQIAPPLFSLPNGLDGTIGGKSVPERSFIHSKKHVRGRNLLTKPAPYLFPEPNWLYGAFWGKIVPDENFAQFCLKSPLTNFLGQTDGNQGGPSLKDLLQVPDGPITRSRAKKIKEAMQGLVQSTWDEASKSPTMQDPLQVPNGPITRSRAKKIKEAMQGDRKSVV